MEVTDNVFDQFADLIADKVAARLAAQRPSPKRLLTAAEAATYLGRSLGAIQHLTSSGDLPTVRTGRRVHYAVEDLDRFVNENKV